MFSKITVYSLTLRLYSILYNFEAIQYPIEYRGYTVYSLSLRLDSMFFNVEVIQYVL